MAKAKNNAVKTACNTLPVCTIAGKGTNIINPITRVNLTGVSTPATQAQLAQIAHYKALSVQYALAALGGAPIIAPQAATAIKPQLGGVTRNTGNGVCAQVHAWLNGNPNATKKQLIAANPQINPITCGVQYGKWLKARKVA